MTRDGRPAPLSPSTVYALGLRNPQGFAWHPDTGTMMAIDHGPTGKPNEGRRVGHDELDQVEPGGDYGWPTLVGRWDGSSRLSPIAEWTPAIAPAGLAFVNDPDSPWHGDVVLSGPVGRTLLRVDVEPVDSVAGQYSARCQSRLLDATYGRLRAVHWGPDGYVYVTTSNRDQRGLPGVDDDRLLRFAPPR